MTSQREKAKRIAWIVSERIREVTTPGLGQWAPTWQIVGEQSDRFMDALYQWELSGTRDDLDAVQREVEALLGAWRLADTRYQVSRLAETPEAVGELTEGAA